VQSGNGETNSSVFGYIDYQCQSKRKEFRRQLESGRKYALEHNPVLDESEVF